MLTNGLTPLSTSGDSPVAVLAAADTNNYSTLTIINMGAVAGFWTVGDPAVPTNWGYLPAAVSGSPVPIVVPFPGRNMTLRIKRVLGGTDLATVWAFLV